MFRTTAAAFAVIILTSAAPAMAADEIAAAAVMTPAAAEAWASPVSAPSMSFPRRSEGPEAHRSLLSSLYVSLAGLNAYDAYSTVKGRATGAMEANVIMRNVAGTPMTVWAIKGGVTAGSILMAEHLWRSHHRAEAIGAMVASNALMAAVGARNAGVLASQR